MRHIHLNEKVPSSIIVVDKTSLLTMWKKKNRTVKRRAAKQVPRDKARFYM